MATFLVSGGMFGATMYLPLFVQGVVGVSAAKSGAALTPLMLGFMVSSTIGGQILSRTGRYKYLALSGFVVATIGMIMLSRMDASVSTGTVVRNTAITGLGIGMMMSLFTIVVQNAFSIDRLGQVTASLQFFRSIGGTISVALLGTVMTNSFQNAFRTSLPEAVRVLVPAAQLEALGNPQMLIAPESTASIQQTFDALGPQGQAIFLQLMEVVRSSLATAITGIFLAGAAAMVIGFCITLFLPEIPLRKGRARVPGASVPVD